MKGAWRLEHIIAGTDYSESSRGAVGEALRLAGRHACEVSVVHIAKGSKGEAGVAEMDAFLEAEDIPDGATVHRVIRKGSKVAALLGEYAEEVDADLLCVGPRARTFVERHLKGGIAEQLFSRTSVATLATARRVDEGYKRVLVAVDDSDAAARALQVGAALLEGDEGQELIALHVLSGRAVTAISSVDEGDELKAALMSDARATYEDFVSGALEDGAGTERWRVEVRTGTLGHQVPRAVEDLEPDVLCMGTVGRRGLLGLLAGNAADRMVRSLGIPLLVAHP